jgi:hypothetical protein
MPISLKTRDLELTYEGDLRLSLDEAGVADIKEVTNEENELLMQNIILRLSSKRDDWAVLNNNIIPLDLTMFLGMPLNETLTNAIINRIISGLVFGNLLSVDEISVASVYYALNECYLAFNIRPKNNQNYKKALLISYDSSNNMLTPTVIDYIER